MGAATLNRPFSLGYLIAPPWVGKGGCRARRTRDAPAEAAGRHTHTRGFPSFDSATIQAQLPLTSFSLPVFLLSLGGVVVLSKKFPLKKKNRWVLLA